MPDQTIMAKLVEHTPNEAGQFDYPSRAQDGAPKRFRFVCPGCAKVNIIALYHKDGINVGPHWSLSGDEDTPSLTPSITTACGWHGGLILGVWHENPAPPRMNEGL